MLFTLGSDDENMFVTLEFFDFAKFPKNIELPAI